MMVRLFPPEPHAVDPSLCFVLMPFKKEFSPVYAQLKKAVEKYAGFQCLRADDLASPTNITDDIWRHIQRARFLIADLTDSNANVFYEVGLCHALGKPVILLSQEGLKVPFDLDHVRYLRYSPIDLEDLDNSLKPRIRACLSSMPATWSNEVVKDKPNVRITGVESPASAPVATPFRITVKSKNFGLDAAEAYFSLSFPSGASSVTIIKSDLPKTKVGLKGGSWKSEQVILDYPIAEAYTYGLTSLPWPSKKSHYLVVEVTPSNRGLMQFYIAASAKNAGQPFINDPISSSLLDQREEPVYCGVIDVF